LTHTPVGKGAHLGKGARARAEGRACPGEPGCAVQSRGHRVAGLASVRGAIACPPRGRASQRARCNRVPTACQGQPGCAAQSRGLRVPGPARVRGAIAWPPRARASQGARRNRVATACQGQPGWAAQGRGRVGRGEGGGARAVQRRRAWVRAAEQGRAGLAWRWRGASEAGRGVPDVCCACRCSWLGWLGALPRRAWDSGGIGSGLASGRASGPGRGSGGHAGVGRLRVGCRGGERARVAVACPMFVPRMWFVVPLVVECVFLVGMGALAWEARAGVSGARRRIPPPTPYRSIPIS